MAVNLPKILLILCLCLSPYLVMGQDTDFSMFMDHTLEFPMTSESMKNWETKGAAIFGKNMMYINPQVKQRQGLVYSTRPLDEKEWMIDVEFAINNEEGSVFGTNGMGIFLLQDVLNKEVKEGSMFGYSNDFIGAGILLNTGMRKRDSVTNKRVEAIQGVVSDGSTTINTWDIPYDDTCYFHYRDPRDKNGDLVFNTLRIHYKNNALDVLYFNKDTNEFVNCFDLSIDFSKGAFIALSASAGVWDEDYHIVRSLKTMNPNKVDKTHHAEQASKLKGQKFIESLTSTQDLMHKNRLRYKDRTDLINKLNKEIKTFLRQTGTLERYVRKEVTQSYSSANNGEQTYDVGKINKESRNVVRDLKILDKMMNRAFSKLEELEQRTK